MLWKLRETIERFIEKRGITTFITGMAIGIDMWSAQIVLKLRKTNPNLKLVCAIPCDKQYIKWSEEDQKTYHKILKEADYVYYVSDEPYTVWCMEVRNKWMVNHARIIIGVWDGVENGGTWNAIKYAKKQQRIIVCINPKTLVTKFP
jgi:uncharacterized phage-like protein YoqJ